MSLASHAVLWDLWPPSFNREEWKGLAIAFKRHQNNHNMLNQHRKRFWRNAIITNPNEKQKRKLTGPPSDTGSSQSSQLGDWPKLQGSRLTPLVEAGNNKKLLSLLSLAQSVALSAWGMTATSHCDWTIWNICQIYHLRHITIWNHFLIMYLVNPFPSSSSSTASFARYAPARPRPFSSARSLGDVLHPQLHYMLGCSTLAILPSGRVWGWEVEEGWLRPSGCFTEKMLKKEKGWASGGDVSEKKMKVCKQGFSNV